MDEGLRILLFLGALGILMILAAILTKISDKRNDPFKR